MALLVRIAFFLLHLAAVKFVHMVHLFDNHFRSVRLDQVDQLPFESNVRQEQDKNERKSGQSAQVEDAQYKQEAQGLFGQETLDNSNEPTIY